MDLNPDQLEPTRPFLIGLLGGLIALRGVPGASWPERFVNLVSASLMAGFLSPAVSEWFGFDTKAMEHATAFLIGVFGLSITVAVMDQIKTIKFLDLLPWPKNRGE